MKINWRAIASSVTAGGLLLAGGVLWYWHPAALFGPANAAAGEVGAAGDAGANAAFKVDGDQIFVTAQAVQTAQLGVDPAVQRDAPLVLNLTGRTGFDMEHVLHVHAPFAGRVVELGPELGSIVAGPESDHGPTVLCVIESTDLANAKNTYLKAKVQVEVDQDALTRTTELVKASVLGEKAVLDATSTLKKDALDKDLARQQLLVFGLKANDIAEIEKEVGRQRMVYRITAPRSGVITEKNLARGELADTASNLFTISDLTRLWVWGDVYERDWSKVKVGQKVKVTVAGRPDEPLDSTIDWISPVIDDTTRSVRIRATLDNQARRLLAGMYATLAVAIDPGTNAVVVPANAVVHKEKQNFVLVQIATAATGTTYKRMLVQTVAVDGTHERVLSGIQAGERVVTQGALGLFEQMTQ